MEKLINPRTGIEVSYLIEGEGDKTILFLHGWTGNHTRWAPTRKLLAKKYRTIAYELRGHGFSEKLPDLDFTFDAYVEDQLGFMEALKIDRCVIAGHSMGGMIEQHFALKYPDMVEKLILVATSACPAPTDRLKKKMKMAAWLFGNLFGLAMSIKDRKKKKQPDLFPDAVNMNMNPIPAAASKSLISIRNMDLRAALKDLKMPVLVVASTDDNTVPYEQSKELAECIPGARFETVSGCSHHIPIERAEFLSQVIDDFISK